MPVECAIDGWSWDGEEFAAIDIHWNTAYLDEAVRQRKHADLTVEPELLVHISSLEWAHILLTGEYWCPKRR